MQRKYLTLLFAFAGLLCAADSHPSFAAAAQQAASKEAAPAGKTKVAAAPQNAPKAETSVTKPQQGCTGDEIRLGALTGTDATGLTKTLNTFFTDFTVSVTTEKGSDSSTICITSREKNKKPKDCKPSSDSFQPRCALNEIARLADNEGFTGTGFSSNFLIPLSHLPALKIAQSFPYPTPDLELHHAYMKYLVLVPPAGSAGQDSTKDGSLAKQAANIRHDLDLLDDLYGGAANDAEFGNAMAAAVRAADDDEPGDTEFRDAARKAEQWLAQHTVRLSYLDPRDVAIALSNVSSEWTFQVRSFGKAITILPALPPNSRSLRTFGAYIAADAIERDTLYRRRVNEDRAPAQQGDGGSGTKAQSPGKGLGPQPSRFDNVVRLYHLRKADKIAEAINKASDKPLVEALDGSGNNDLLLILPSPSGGPEQGPAIHRAIALLDLPRPQLSLQVWSYQISAEAKNNGSEKAKGTSSVQSAFEHLRDAVNDSNRRMTESIQRGFGQILDEAQDAQARSDTTFDVTLRDYLTGRYDECVMRDSYCLGYLDALAISAGADRAVNASLSRLLLYLIPASDSDALDLARNVIEAMQPQNCPANISKLDPAGPVPLCFIMFFEQLTVALQPRNLHILRAALLDFLFEYKWTTSYPNDFVSYDLQRTAHFLDSLLLPIIEAFNEDLDDYVMATLQRVACQAASDSEKAGFIGHGMVQVATLSGSQAIVDAKVNNYFDITPPLSLNDILNTDNQKNLSANLKNVLEPKEILALQSLANIGSRPRVMAEVSREAKLTITPTTLDTASSAQLDVDFDVSEQTAPQGTTPSGAQKDLLDRVADHHVTTHVRVESLKLFQVSAFTMELAHPQPGWPLPVIGWGWQAIFGSTPGLKKVFLIPRPPKTEDNRSVAIVRAVVVPTAMDLALGMPFMGDRIFDPVTEATDPMNSVAQAGGRLCPFHKHVVRCILNGNNDCLLPGSPNWVRLSSTLEDLRDPTTP
jgi:hypothetical protein